MMKFVLLVLALIAVASAQILYSGIANGANLHGPYAASTSSGIRRYGSTGGFINTAYSAPIIAGAYAPGAYAAPYAAPYAATYAI